MTITVVQRPNEITMAQPLADVNVVQKLLEVTAREQ